VTDDMNALLRAALERSRSGGRVAAGPASPNVGAPSAGGRPAANFDGGTRRDQPPGEASFNAVLRGAAWGVDPEHLPAEYS
jgi:hypothetical protein